MKGRIWLGVALAVVLGALGVADHALSGGRSIGWERNSVRNSRKRWAKQPQAKVAIFGSSTSKDWLPAGWLARLLKVPAGQVLDAHINGCHQGCTWAEVRGFRREGRHFEAAFFGTNLFQLCEFPHTKRILQQQMMVPAADVPLLLGKYLHAQTPLLYMGRLLGVSLSGAYGDTAAVRAKLEKLAYDDADPRARAVRRHNAWRWARKRPVKVTKPPLSCEYTPEAVALKRAFTEGLMADLAGIADHTYLMLLPDRTRSLKDPEQAERWARHLAMHREIAAGYPNVTIIDLVTDGAADAKLFRDGFHLNGEGMKRQRALFQRRLATARGGR